LDTLGENGPSAQIALVMMACVFMAGNWYYVLWVVSLIFKFPEFVNFGVMKAFIGLVEQVHSKLGETLAQQRGGMDSLYRKKQEDFRFYKEEGREEA